MGFFEKLDNFISGAIEDLLDDNPQDVKNKAHSKGWSYEDDIRAAEAELEEFLRGKAGVRGEAGVRGKAGIYGEASAAARQDVPPEVCASFAELGLKTGASFADSKKAFRELSKRHHPDRAGGAKDADASVGGEKFMRIKSAYDIITKWYEKK